MITREIVDELRSEIVRGAFPEDCRLPTREELTLHYGTSKATVQKALATLESEGFVISRGKLGTFVNPQAPHVNDIAIILPHRADQITEWNLLSQLLQLHGADLNRRFGKNFRYFYIDPEQHVRQDFEAIAREAECNHFKGVIFPLMPSPWMVEPFVANGIPVVILTEENVPGAITVWLDYRGMIEQSLAYFQSRGCRRAAILCDVRFPYEYVELFSACAARYGLDPRPEHVHAVSTVEPHALRWFSHQLAASLETAERVDALLIADYAFLAPTLKRLRELQLEPDRDVVLAAHANFPGPERNAWPAKLFGFDIFDIIGHCLDALDGRHAADSLVPVINH